MEQQADRRIVGPLKVVDNQDQGPFLGERADDIGILLEHPVLVDRCRPAAAIALQQPTEPAGLLDDRLTEPGGQSGTGDDRADQVRPEFEQHLGGAVEKPPEPTAIVITTTLLPDALVVEPDERGKELAEGQERVADPALAVAVAGRHHDLVVCGAQLGGKRLDQRRLTGAGLSGDERYPPPTADGLGGELMKTGPLCNTSDEARSDHHSILTYHRRYG